MEVSCRELFGIESGITFDVQPPTAIEAPFVPAIDPDYVFSEEVLQDFLAWHLRPYGSEGLWAFGPTGSGKTSMIEQIYARLQKPIVVVQCSKIDSWDDLLYRIDTGKAEDGDLIKYTPVQVALAIINGWPLLLDEGDVLAPQFLLVLNGLLEGAGINVPKLSSEPLVPAEGFRIILTANTAGGGDSTGLHLGTKSQNAATRNRFIKLPMTYPSALTEMRILAGKFPDLEPQEVEEMVKLANDARLSYVGDPTRDASTIGYESRLTTVISTRTLLLLGHYRQVYSGFYDADETGRKKAYQRALNRVLLDGAPASDQETILSLAGLNASSTSDPF